MMNMLDAVTFSSVAAVLCSVFLVAHGLGFAADAPAGVIQVAPDGDDAWSGGPAEPDARKTDGPLASLNAALAAARRMDRGRIVLQGGKYFLDAPVVLEARDSGLVIEAAPNARPVLYGGRRITGWRRDGRRFFSARVPDTRDRTWDFRMLVVNGRFCRRARLPAKGHFTHLSEWNVPWMSTTGGGWKTKPTAEDLTTMKYRPEDLGAWFDPDNAEITVYHMWDESVVGVLRNDTETCTLTFSNPCGHPPGAFGVKKYVVWNVREGLTEPGQWYLDRTAGKIVYRPRPGEDMTKAEVIAPTTESILILRGEDKARVSDITLRGLVLSVTNTPLKAGGFGAGKFDGAIQILHSADCRLQELEIVNVGGQGIKEWGSTGLRIERCHIHHTGACGIKCGGGDALVADCRIHHVGVTYPSAIALWGGGKTAGGVRFVHNEIHDTPYTAVACGGNDHLIEGNRIYRAMQELHDGAGIYITFCKRITLRGNFIYDIIDTGGYGASAYYLDEQAEDCLVEKNVSIGVARPSHNHMAWGNTIRNNVFVIEGDATFTFPKSRDYRFEKNVVRAAGQITFTNPEAITDFEGNVLWSAKGRVIGRKLRDYSKTGSAPLTAGAGSVLADPRFLVYRKGRIRFARNSPALALSIEPVDVSGAGPRPASRTSR